MLLEGKVAVITGAASGIGKAIAEKMAVEGANVVVSDYNGGKAEKISQDIRSKGHDVLPVTCDVRDEAEIKSMFENTVNKWAKIDILVNNAGIWDVTPVEAIALEDLQKVFAVNIQGALFCSKHVLPYFRKNGGGAVVNLSSVAGLIGGNGVPAYNMSKHAIIGLTRNMTADYAREKVRVNAVCPGIIATDMGDQLVKDYGGPEALEMLKEKHLAGRFGQPEEIANVVTFLASDEASFMYGSVVAVDGGLTAV